MSLFSLFERAPGDMVGQVSIVDGPAWSRRTRSLVGEKVEEVDWFNTGETNRAKGQLGQTATYVISTVGEGAKRSEEYSSCTGFYAIGLARDGSVISFLVHLNSFGLRKKFHDDFINSLRRFKSQVDMCTISVGFFGGEVPPPSLITYMNFNDYNAMLSTVRKLVRQELSMQVPIVAKPCPPNRHSAIVIEKNGQVTIGRIVKKSYL